MIEVSAAIIHRDDCVLLCRRGEGGPCAYLWEFPGGKREPRETPEECLRRECREELGIGIDVGALFAKTCAIYPDRKVSLMFFNASIVEGEPTARVHLQLVWAPRDTLLQYELCPADAEVARQLAAAL